MNFDITASAEDIKETEDWVNDLKPEFAEAKNVLEFANLSSEKRFQPKYYKKGELDNEELDEFLFTEKSDGVFGPYLKDNAYNIVRVADRRVLPDSVRARHILIASNNMAQSEKLADSLAGLIRKGGDFDALARPIFCRSEYFCKWWGFRMVHPRSDAPTDRRFSVLL